MPTPVSILPAHEDESVNFRLWIGLLLPPTAAGINTVVGYMVSNYDCNVHNRHLVLLVNVLSALLCGMAALSSLSARRMYKRRADGGSLSLLHSRQFMFRLGVCFAAGCLLLITAGTLSTFLLRPCDL